MLASAIASIAVLSSEPPKNRGQLNQLQQVQSCPRFLKARKKLQKVSINPAVRPKSRSSNLPHLLGKQSSLDILSTPRNCDIGLCSKSDSSWRFNRKHANIHPYNGTIADILTSTRSRKRAKPCLAVNSFTISGRAIHWSYRVATETFTVFAPLLSFHIRGVRKTTYFNIRQW